MPWLEDLKFPRGYQMGTHKKKLTDKELRNSLKGFTGITNDKSNFDSTGNLMINDSESIKMFNKYSDLANLVIRAYSPMYSFNPDI